MRYCRHCGAELIEGASFCGKCGNLVDVELQEEQPTSAIGETVALKEEMAPVYAAQQEQPQPVPDPEPTPAATPEVDAGFQQPYQEQGAGFQQPYIAPGTVPYGAPGMNGTGFQQGYPGYGQNPYEDQMRAQAEMEARIRAEAEARVRMEYEQKRKKERADAARKTMQNATGGFLSGLKYYGKFMPEKGIKEVSKVKGGFAWIIYLCAAWIAFSFGFAVFEQQLLRGTAGTFGGWLGASAIVWLAASGVVIGLSFLYVRVIKKKQVSFIPILNMVAYATLPVTCIMLLNMLLGLISPVICFITLPISVLYFFILLTAGLNSFMEQDEKSGMAVIIIAILVILISIGLLVLIGKAVVEAGIYSQFNNYFGGGGYGGFDMDDLFDMFN